MEKKTIIYAIIDPRDNECRYVGKTSQKLKYRIHSHKRTSEKNHRANWIKSICSDGFDPIFIVLEELPYEQGWVEAEQFWISYFKFLGARLTNQTIGGEGCSGVKRSEATKEKYRANANSPKMKAIASINIKKAIASNIGRKQEMTPKNLESKRKSIMYAIAYNTGRKQTEEHTRKCTEYKIGRPALPSRVLKQSESSKHRNAFDADTAIAILELHFIGNFPIYTLARKFNVHNEVIKRLIETKSYLWLVHPLRCPVSRHYYIESNTADVEKYDPTRKPRGKYNMNKSKTK